MPFWQEWALIEGLNDWYKAQSPEGGGGAYDGSTPGLSVYSDETLAELGYDPRFPSSSRGDQMATVEQIQALGMQYSKQ